MKIRETTLRQATNDDNADRAPIIRAFLDNDAPWVDNFAGAGGASLGLTMLMEELIGAGMLGIRTLGPDIAINHSPEALALHEANHPETKHIIANVWEVNPVRVCKGRRPLIGWFSPTCTFFSRARGEPLSPEAIKIRGLCWVATRWAASKVRPRVLLMENVEEFQKFGPLHKQHSHGCSAKWAKKHAKRLKNGKRKPCCKKRCQYLTTIKAKEGSLYRAFLKKLRRYYKYVETAVLSAHEYGAPTSRKRWFLYAGDHPFTFPKPTHGPAGSGLLPYRTAAECIDWSIPCPSIFERAKPLVDTTLARIRAGAHKFVLNASRPFIVPVAYGRDVNRAVDIDDPMRTICGNRGGHGLVTPFVARTAHGDVDRKGKRRGLGAHSLEAPLGTVCAGGTDFAAVSPLLMKAKTYGGGGNDAKPADTPLTSITCSKRGEHAIGVPYLAHVSNGERPGQDPRVYDIERPLSTVVAGGIKHGLTLPVLIKNNGGTNDERVARGGGGGTIAQRVDEPLHTIATHNTKSVAAISGVKLRGTSEAHVNAGCDIDAPLSSISAGGDRGGVHHGVQASYLVRYNGARDGEARGQLPDEPISTLDTSNRFATVAAYLVRYNGTGDAESVVKPCGTLTTKERFGLTTITLARDLCDKAMRVATFLGYDKPLVLVLGGEEWVLVDIGFRMLTPRELYRCQGFPDSYKIDPIFNGKPLSKTAQIKGVGNSVPPIIAKKWAQAALAPLIGGGYQAAA